jgi:hypothetical protein
MPYDASRTTGLSGWNLALPASRAAEAAMCAAADAESDPPKQNA